MRERRALQWQVGHTGCEIERPNGYIEATVPGAVQLDYAAAHGWEPYWKGCHFTDYGWMEDRYWVYRAELLFTCGEAETACVVFKGLDYRYSILVDGKERLRGEGMYTERRIDVTDCAGALHLLEVVLFPVPKVPGAAPGRRQAAACCKPPVSYDWDWHPRLIPTGIWDEAYLEVGGKASVESWTALVEMAEDLSSAQITVEAETGAPTPVRLELLDERGTIVAACDGETNERRALLCLQVNAPALWWPSEYGEQPLYTLRLITRDDVREKTVGFRRVRLVMNEGEWEKPSLFPKSQSTNPITLEINGRRLFAKGSNWVPPEIFPGVITDDTYSGLLTLAKEAHMNLLRVWGGGIVNKDSFFEQCDRLGLMVWQEFPLACNGYPDDPAYLAVLEQEAVSMLLRLRSHPCVAIWCGGNELLNKWSGMTIQSHPLRLLDSLCYRYDRQTPYLPTSPLFGMAHGHYCNVDEHGEETITQLMGKDNTAYTEFGSPGPSPAAYIRGFLDEEEFRQGTDAQAWRAHHAHGAWDMMPDTWLRESEAVHYFGGYTDTEDLIEKLMLVQSMGYQSLYEEMRRQWPRCSMALSWCFNEPWPTAANNSLINWPCRPKPAYHAVKQALRAQMASLRLEKRIYRCGEEASAQIWLLNDSFVQAEADDIRLYAEFEGERIHLLTWEHADAPAGRHRKGPTAAFTLPDHGEGTFRLALECSRFPDRNSSYICCLRPAEDQSPADALNI